ncbi:MAG: HAD family hydrolase [Sphingobacteriaceae bacterium]|nr:MAG: HAD family hydrolase [Sphingobacteriaceae bacterium]
MTFRYADLDPQKKAFVFELDNVLFPQQDYDLQVYYLFAAFLEHTEQLNSKVILAQMQETYQTQGADAVFTSIKTAFSLNEKYRENFERLLKIARLPLKLLLYQQMLELLQQIVIDRKQLFILTNGDPEQQLNKIKQTEWNGLEKYLVCYFAREIKPKPEPDALHQLLADHHLQRREIMMIGNNPADALCAQAAGVDYATVFDFVGKNKF